MRQWLVTLISASCLICGTAAAQSFKTDVGRLIQASCIHCHDADTKTSLNLKKLGHDLSKAKTFRKWEKVFDRVRAGEMPPKSEDRPNPKHVKQALGSLKKKLRATSLSRQRRIGRVPARRLTKLELRYTLSDLLLIKGDVTSSVPDEVESGSFNTVGSTQRISAVHMASYLKTADRALGLAVQLGRKPYAKRVTDFSWLDDWHEKPLNLGGSITRKLSDGIALFADVDYLTRYRFRVTTQGLHRITSKVAAFQSKKPVTIKVIVKEVSGGARLVKAADINPGKTETIAFDVNLKPGDSPYLTFHTGKSIGESFGAIGVGGGAKNYKGPGIAIKLQQVEGPLYDSWPPKSTRQLLRGTKLVAADKSPRSAFKIELSKKPIQHVTEIVRQFASRAFRRPTSDAELDSFVSLAKPAIKEGRSFVNVVRLPLRSMLSSPQFLMFEGKAGKLDDYGLANRLSYFLWKSMPDDELFALAKAGKLSDSKVLAGQVDRMLANEKSNRFVRDFLGQWLQLYKVNATTPDEKLYPEYDELLGNGIPQEPQLFFAELVKKNLSITNLIRSDFTFVNRRLADHYGLSGIKGQQFRRVQLPKNSPRGGLLTQAAILKTTANGTVTSPVTRGNFVLTSILGTPPSPPPPNVGSIEPDTRGNTTIRQILAAHRKIETCAKCHREIDPPGFALESFDPIGGFRKKYRANAKTGLFSFFGGGKSYRDGPKVDPSGVTSNGQKFSGIQEFKRLLLSQKEQIAKHFVSQLVVYSTGGEIQFADREEIAAILKRTRKDDFPVKRLIHEIVQSGLFRNK